LALIRALGRSGVEVVAAYYDREDMGFVSRFASCARRVAHPERSEATFIRNLKSIGEEYPGAVLFPADDSTLIAVSRHRDELSGQFRVACPSWDIARAVVQKEHTYDIAESAGVPHPRTLHPSSWTECRDFIDRTGFPFVMKPSQSHLFHEKTGVKLWKIFTEDDAIRHWDQAATMDLSVLLQEYIPGNDTLNVNYNAFAVDGVARFEYTAAKVRLSPPDSGVPCIVQGRPIPEVVESGRRILEALGYTGYACVELKFDERDNMYKLLEVNGRHNRSAALAVKSGLNFPLIEYAHHCGETVGTPGPVRSDLFWIDLVRDLYSARRYVSRPGGGLSGILKPYFSPHVFAVVARDDIRPILKRARDLARKAAGSVFSKLVHRKGRLRNGA